MLQETTSHFDALIGHAGLVDLEEQYSSSDTVYNREVMKGPEARYYWEEVHAWLAKYLSDE